MKKITTKKLSLHNETIKVLTEDSLRSAAGGMWQDSWSLYCKRGGESDYCSGTGGCGSGARG